MTEYYLAWLQLINTRDQFYLLALLLVAAGLVWYKLGPLHHKFAATYIGGGVLLVSGLVGWGATLV